MKTSTSALVRFGLSLVAVAALASAPVAAAPAKPTKDAALIEAVSRASRPAQDVARDGARHPLESLTFWGVKPGQTVVEIMPGAGYWTEILAPYAKATGGRYIVGLADISSPTVSEAARKGRADFLAKYADTKLYGTVEPTNYGATSGPLAPAGTVDLFLTLKPGGILAIEEHRSDPRPMDPEARDGYMSEASVIDAAKKAGFVLDARSDVNANPKDTKDHPFGVWTLAPSRRSAPAGQPANPAFDRLKYDAIGESDRMTLRFRKPR